MILKNGIKRKPISDRTRKNIKIAKLSIISGIFLAVTALVAVIAVSIVMNTNFRETFYNVSSLKIDNKIRVIQISDLHGNKYGKDNKKLTDRVKKLKPDLIVYTGDIIDSGDKSNDVVLNLIKDLSDVAPSYYIYGNNEVEKYYGMALTQEALDEKFGFDDSTRDAKKLLEIQDSFQKEIEKAGAKVLKNSKDTVKIGTNTVDIYGVLTSNPSSFWSYAGESFDEHIYEDTNNLKLTLIHEPTVFEEYEPESWGDVILAGHTHGGTVKVPVLGPLFTREGGLFPQRSGHLVYGRYDISGRPLVVSSGLDDSILRINNQPELVIVDINRY